jgi:hypothetical protein
MSPVPTNIRQGNVPQSAIGVPAPSFGDQLQSNLASQLNGLAAQGSLAQSAYDDRVALDRNNVGRQQDFINADLFNANASIGLSRDALTTNQNAMNQMYGIDYRQYQNQMAQAGQGRDINAAGIAGDYTNTTTNQDLRFGRDSRALLSDATGRGATITEGFRQGNTDLASQLAADRTKATGDRDLANQRNNLAYDQTTGNLTAAQEGRSVVNSRDNELFANSARQLGIKSDEAQLAFNRGMQNLGYDSAVASSILDAAQSAGNSDLKAQAQALMMQSMQLGAMYPSTMRLQPVQTVKPTPTVRSDSRVRRS